MRDPLTIAALGAAAVALLWLVAMHARYRAVYRYDDADLRAARRDATRRSRAVIGGQAGEQLAPLVPEFCRRFDPGEARFLGAPVDYLIFDGLGAGDLREIVLLEVKTGGSRLNANEREVERAVREGRVRFELMRLR